MTVKTRPGVGAMSHARRIKLASELEKANYGFRSNTPPRGPRGPTKDTRTPTGGQRRFNLIDPVACERVSFSTPLQVENWMLKRFNPSIIYLDARRDEWSVVHRGRLLKAKPHLQWSRLGDHGVLEVVIEPGNSVCPERQEELEIIARAHHCRAEFRFVEEIRREPRLLALLERMRQTMTLELVRLHDPWVGQRLLNPIRRAGGTLTRGELVWQLGEGRTPMSEQLIDAALFWLRQINWVDFDFPEGRYDDLTIIACR